MLGEYRQNHDDWKPTATNLRKRTRAENKSGYIHWRVNISRLCYSHEYMYKENAEMEKRLTKYGLDLDKKIIDR